MSLLYLSSRSSNPYLRGLRLIKQGAASQPSYAMAGTLYLSKSGWLLLSVPNAFARGAFDALREPGIELPTGDDGQFNAHISVIRPEELAQIGGPEKITERGHAFHYTPTRLRVVEPDGWAEMSRCWFLEVKSPELERLRKSYGLTAKPKNNEYEFHITVAVRRRRVFQPGPSTTKLAPNSSVNMKISAAVLPFVQADLRRVLQPGGRP